jgi:ribonuclease P protein subunit POP4
MKLATISEYDLIGQEINISQSKNKEIIGLKGKVIMETKNMITLQTEDGKKSIPKDICQFSNNQGLLETDSTKLSKRPHERMEILV